MAHGRGIKVELHQCLFGYDEGHRLLAASKRLPDEASSLLLLYSDLVPGLHSSSFKEYWTGVPVAALKSYALMRTWPAPEMPRPGCVWTQVLLIGFADMASFTELAALRNYFARPLQPGAYEAYKTPIFAEASEVARLDASVSFARDCLRVLRALYAPGSKGVVSSSEGDIERAIFAAWSQQWPRLRRSFYFCTARAASEPAVSRDRFDLRLTSQSTIESLRDSANADDLMEPWEREAMSDLLHGPAEFRRFIWRYGSDQRRGRERFRFLAELYASIHAPSLSGGSLTRVLEQVAQVLPNPDDGKLLKEDLVAAGQTSYSLLPAGDPLDILYFVASGADQGAFPPPSAAIFDSVRELWSEQSAKILSIAEHAAEQESAVADQVLQRLAEVADPATFLSISRGHSRVRLRLAEANPSLLDSPDLLGVRQPELNELLGFVSDPELADRLVRRLVALDDADVSHLLMSRFPDVVDGHVLASLTRLVMGQRSAVPESWLDAVRSYDPPSLARRLLGRVSTTGALAACAVLLQLDLRLGLSVNCDVWAVTLAQAWDDVGGEYRQRLFAYLLSLALAQPVRGCEPLFERSFELVHTDVWNASVPQDAFATLAQVLPDLYWWQQWDTCLRLRQGVVDAYVNANLKPESFRRLTHDSSLLRRLIELANESKSGRRYIKRVMG